MTLCVDLDNNTLVKHLSDTFAPLRGDDNTPLADRATTFHKAFPKAAPFRQLINNRVKTIPKIRGIIIEVDAKSAMITRFVPTSF